MQALAIEAIQGLSANLVWVGLLHSLWLGFVAAAVTALIFQTRRALSHRSRHATLLTALCVVAFGPLVFTAVQYVTAGWRAGNAPASATRLAVGTSADLTDRLLEGFPRPAAPSRGADVRTTPLFRLLGFALDRATVAVGAVRPFALTAWSLIVLGLSVVLAVGVKGVNQLCRDASVAPSVVRQRAQELGRLLRLRTVPAIRVHKTVDEPCLCGMFRPVILLPGRWLAAADADLLDAVLAHELAHARRFDHLVNLAQRVVEVLLFFHPGFHWLSRSLRRQRELCADALAVRLTGDPLALAKALESVARLRVRPATPRLAGAALVGESSSLLLRIQELIGMTPVRPRLQIWPFAALPSALAMALVTVSIGFAGDEPRPSPATAAPVTTAPVTRPIPSTAPPAPPISKTQAERMISYEVRIIDLDPDAWRHLLDDRLTPLKQGAGSSGWILDQPAVTALLKYVQGAGTAKLLQAPKVTAYENAHAVIFTGPGGPGDDKGLCVDLSGSRLPQGTRVLVKASDSALVTGRAGRAGDPEAASSPKPSAPTVVYYKGSCDVPEQSSLAFSLGWHARDVGARHPKSERLVVITPRRILLESEEKPVVKTASKQTAQPAAH